MSGPTPAIGSRSAVAAVTYAPGIYNNSTGVGTSAAALLPAWATGKTYLKGDVVTASGVTYVCIASGTTTSIGSAPGAGTPDAARSALLGQTWTTADGAQWCAVTFFANEIAIRNTHASQTLYVALDSAATSSSTAIWPIPAGQADVLPWAVAASSLQVFGSGSGTTYAVQGLQ